MTCPGCTSSEIPFSTSSRPKRLCTPSALTIAWLTAGHCPPKPESEPARQGRRLLRPAEPAPVPALDEVLADVEDARHQEVPDARDDQQRDLLVVRRRRSAGPSTAARCTRTTLASEVFFSIEITSLPVGGMITRIACGSTIRRIVWIRDMPSDCAASDCPSATEMMPARTISAMYAASLRRDAEDRRDEGRDQRVAVRADDRRAAERNAQIDLRIQRGDEIPEQIWRAAGSRGRTRCTASSTPEISGFGDRRMTARMTPSRIPITIEMTVSRS